MNNQEVLETLRKFLFEPVNKATCEKIEKALPGSITYVDVRVVLEDKREFVIRTTEDGCLIAKTDGHGGAR